MPQIQSGETFEVGQQFTAARANNHVNGALLLKGAITEQSPLAEPQITDSVLIANNTGLYKTSVENLLKAPGSYLNPASLIVDYEFIIGPNSIYWPPDQTETRVPSVSVVPGIQADWYVGMNMYGIFNCEAEATFNKDIFVGTAATPENPDAHSQFDGKIQLLGELNFDEGSKITIGPTSSTSPGVDLLQRVRIGLKDIEINKHLGLWWHSYQDTRRSWNDVPLIGKILWEKTYVVPVGEKWVIELGLNHGAWYTDDAFSVATLVNDVVFNHWRSSEYHSVNNSQNLNHPSFETLVLTQGTHNIKIRGAVHGGASIDWFAFSGMIDINGAGWETAAPVTPYPATDLNYFVASKWEEKITKIWI